MEEGTFVPELEKILDRRLKKKGNNTRVDFLVQQKGSNVEDATWIDTEDLRQTYPVFEDEFFQRKELCYEPSSINEPWSTKLS